jgi:hypothetical protein
MIAIRAAEDFESATAALLEDLRKFALAVTLTAALNLNAVSDDSRPTR